MARLCDWAARDDFAEADAGRGMLREGPAQPCASFPVPAAEETMITEYVLFDLPASIAREKVVEGMHEVAPRWTAEPDLIRKTFVYDPKAGQAGAFYLWKNRAAAERAHGEAWRQRIRSAYGSEPTVRYFETPLVVDNALGRVIAEAA